MEIRKVQQKRACNMVWTAAGQYGFEPQYLFFQMDDEPSLYLNTLEGLGYSCMKQDILLPFLKGIEIGKDPDIYRYYVQLILEQAVFLRMKDSRPALLALREEYAKHHLTELRPPARYQDMSEQRLVLLHWYRVTGKNLEPFTKRELELAGDMETLAEKNAKDQDDEALVEGIKELLWRYYYYRFTKARESEKTAFVGAGLLMVLLGKLFHSEFRLKTKQDKTGDTTAGGGHLRILWRHLLNQTTDAEDAAFVKQIFGDCIFDEQQMEKIEAEYCVGYHTLCHLWYAGAQPLSMGKDTDAQYGKEQKEQLERNLSYYNSNRRYFERCILQITDHLKYALETKQEADIVHSLQGRLDAGAVYRIHAMHDLAVFRREITEPSPEICVELVLDASSSRVQEQESLAAQAYIITRSLMNLQIPVQVISFRSQRSYTILQRLKGYESTDNADGIFSFFTAGNNRDGLALRALQPLFSENGEKGKKRILLVLTDAVVLDLQKAYVPGTFSRGQEYQEALAAEDTRETIQMLRKQGICVAAIFKGGNYALEDLKTIYGSAFARIREIRQLPEAVIGLLLRILGELKEQG